MPDLYPVQAPSGVQRSLWRRNCRPICNRDTPTSPTTRKGGVGQGPSAGHHLTPLRPFHSILFPSSHQPVV